MLPQIWSRAIGYTKVHKVHSLEFEECGLVIWASLHTWDRNNFRRVAVSFLDSIESDAAPKLSVVESVVAAVDNAESAVAISGECQSLGETYVEYLGSWYRERLVDHAIFLCGYWRDVCTSWRRRCSVAWTPFPWPNIFWLDWRGRTTCLVEVAIQCPRAIITNELQMPLLVDIVNKVVGVWPLIVSYPYETGEKTDGDRSVV